MNEANFRYNAQLAGEIETGWQKRWEEDGVFFAANPVGDLAGEVANEKMFIMDMFPYPSGKGLHVGHPLGYIATDAYARFQRMLGKNVLYTMGYDAFGLPAEQYAVQTGTHPRVSTEENIANMKNQLFRLGLSHDSRRSIKTIDPEYVKWTQWIFLQIFNSWYDPFFENADGTLGKARPISELKGAIQDRDVDPWALAEKLGIELPEYWKDRKPADAVWNPEHDTPFDWLVQYEPEHMQELVNCFRLAYVSDTPVNWCPGLGTVLANEEVTADGRSERGNFPVFKKSLRQWNMRITAYAQRLLDDLEFVDWPDAVKSMQRHWIGKSEGSIVSFDLADTDGSFEVFTTRVDTLFGATFCALTPTHSLLSDVTQLPESWPADIPAVWTGGAENPQAAVAAYQQQAATGSTSNVDDDAREKTGVFTGLWAINPMDGRKLPVFVADYVLTGYGSGAVMAVPAEDERDWAFAEKYELDVIRTVEPPADHDGGCYTGEGEKINSANAELDLNGLDIATAKKRAIEYAAEKGFGRPQVQYRLRDWLFSRQRYWGEPFPIVYAEDDPDNPIALPFDQLPVQLPDLEDFSPQTFDPEDKDSQPKTPLSRNEEWEWVTLDLGQGEKRYRRETNTMPNWAGSSWYEIRYTDPTNPEALAAPENEAYWMGPKTAGDTGGVDLYVGGVEHAVLHLLYARFWHKVLFDLGHLSSREPFKKLFNQGYVQAYAYTDERGVYVPAAEVEEVKRDGKTVYLYQGKEVKQEYGKMGKSLKNMITPDEMCEEYGADTFRVYEMSMGPLDVSRPWETRAVVGAQRFLQRLWRLAIDEETGESILTDAAPSTATLQALHRTIAGVRSDLEGLRFNTVVAKLIELVNHLTKEAGQKGFAGTNRDVFKALTLMTAPLAPHIAEELWHRIGEESTITHAAFPEADEKYLVEDQVTCVIQIKGKVRASIEVSPDISKEDLEKAALGVEKIQQLIGDNEIRKVIVIVPKLVNIVI